MFCHRVIKSLLMIICDEQPPSDSSPPIMNNARRHFFDNIECTSITFSQYTLVTVYSINFAITSNISLISLIYTCYFSSRNVFLRVLFTTLFSYHSLGYISLQPMQCIIYQLTGGLQSPPPVPNGVSWLVIFLQDSLIWRCNNSEVKRTQSPASYRLLPVYHSLGLYGHGILLFLASRPLLHQPAQYICTWKLYLQAQPLVS